MLTDITINESCKKLAICSTEYVTVYSVVPLKEVFKMEERHCRKIVQYKDSSLCGMVCIGLDKKLNKFVLYDINQRKQLAELNMSQPIKEVVFSPNKLILRLRSKLHVFELSKLNPIRTMELDLMKDFESDFSNLCGVSNDGIYLVHANGGFIVISDISGSDCSDEKQFKAHQSQIACLSVNVDGKNVATASEKGTIIRVYSIPDGHQLYTLRRGTIPAHIYSISFRGMWLSVTSEKSTLHFFKLEGQSGARNEQSVGTFVDTLSNMWDIVKSKASFHVKYGGDKKHICSITQDMDIVVASLSGDIYVLNLVNNELELKRQDNIIKS